jgi:hypothetical protein
MPIYEVKGTAEDVTERILDSIIEQVKFISTIKNQTQGSKMLMFQTYFRGLKDGLRIASGGILNQEDPVINMINNDIIGGIISGKLSDKEGWQIMLTLEAT